MLHVLWWPYVILGTPVVLVSVKKWTFGVPTPVPEPALAIGLSCCDCWQSLWLMWRSVGMCGDPPRTDPVYFASRQDMLPCKQVPGVCALFAPWGCVGSLLVCALHHTRLCVGAMEAQMPADLDHDDKVVLEMYCLHHFGDCKWCRILSIVYDW